MRALLPFLKLVRIPNLIFIILAQSLFQFCIYYAIYPERPAGDLRQFILLVIASVFIELGATIAGLAVLARLASRIGLTPIPFYLIAGLVLGHGGLIPLHFSEQFIGLTAEIGVILLLFMLGLEYTGAELSTSRSPAASSAATSAQ